MKDSRLVILILAVVALTGLSLACTSYADNHLEEVPQETNQSSTSFSEGQLYIPPPKVYYYGEEPTTSPETESEPSIENAPNTTVTPEVTTRVDTSSPKTEIKDVDKSETIKDTKDTKDTKDEKGKKDKKEKDRDKEEKQSEDLTDNTLKTDTSDAEEDTTLTDEEIQKKIEQKKAAQEKARTNRLDSQKRVKQSLKRESFQTNDTTRRDIDFTGLDGQVESVGGMVGNKAPAINVVDNKKNDLLKRIVDKKAIEDAADKEDKENAEKEKKIKDKVKKAKEEAKKKKKFADEEKEKRKNKKRREMDERKKKLKDKREELKDRQKKLKEKAEKLKKKGKDFKQMDQNFREMEDEAKKGPPADPNCRSSACQGIRDLRTDLARDRNQLAKDQGSLQKDMGAFNRDARSYQKGLRDYEKLKDKGYGMDKDDYKAHLEKKKLEAIQDARLDVRKQISDLKRKAKWQGLTKGVSDKEAKEFRDEMKGLESQLDKANSAVQRQEASVFKADAQALGLKDSYDAANKYATKAGGGGNGRPDAGAFEDIRDQMRERKGVQNLSDGELDQYSKSYGKIVHQLEGLEREIGGDKIQTDFSVKKLGDFNGNKGELDRVDKKLKEIRDSKSFKDQNKAWRKTNNDVSDALTKVESWHRKLESLGDADPIRRDGNFEEPEDFPGLDEQRRKNSMSFTGPKELRGDVVKARQQFEKATQNYVDAVEKHSNTSMHTSEYEKLDKKRQALQDKLRKNIDGALADQLGQQVGNHNLDRKNGLPLGKDGKVDRDAFAKNVADMTEQQMKLAQNGGELEYVKKRLNDIEKSKSKPTTVIKGQKQQLEKRQKTLEKEKETLTTSLRKEGVSIKEEDGKITPHAATREGGITWNVARKGVVDFYEKQAKARKKVEDATGQKMAGSNPQTPSAADKEKSTKDKTGKANTITKDAVRVAKGGRNSKDVEKEGGLPGASKEPQPFSTQDMGGTDTTKLTELKKGIKHADEMLAEIDKDLKKEKRSDARKSFEQSRRGWLQEKKKLLAEQREIKQTATRKSSGNVAEAPKKAEKRTAKKSDVAKTSPANGEATGTKSDGPKLKKLKKEINHADEMISAIDKDIKKTKNKDARKTHEKTRLAWQEEKKKLITQQQELKRKGSVTEKAKKRIEVPSYFIDEYRFAQKQQKFIKKKLDKAHTDLKKAPAGSSERKVLLGMKKRYQLELETKDKKIASFENTLASMPGRQRAELLGEKYVDKEEIRRRGEFELFVKDSVIPALNKSQFSEKVLPTLLVSLAHRFGSIEAEQILDSALDRLEEMGDSSSGVLLADIIFEYITTTYAEKGNKEGTRLSLLAHSSFLAEIIRNKSIQKKWKVTVEDREELQENLNSLAQKLAKEYGEKIRSNAKDPDKTLRSLAELLSVYGLPAEKHTDPKAALTQIIKILETATGQKGLKDPEASYRTGQQLLLGLEYARKYLNSRSGKERSNISKENLARLTVAYADTYKLMAQASRELAAKSQGKMAESLRATSNKMKLAEARMRFRMGSHEKALKLARNVEMTTKGDKRLKTKVLIGLIDEYEQVYPYLNSKERKTVSLKDVQKEREKLLETLLGSDTPTVERVSAIIRLARLKEAEGKTDVVDYFLRRMLTEIPDNPFLASEQLRLHLNRPGKKLTEKQVEQALSEVNKPLRLAAAITTIQNLVGEGNSQAAKRLVNALDKANKNVEKTRWINTELIGVVNVQLAFARITLQRSGEQGKGYDRKLNRLINDALSMLRADDYYLEHKTFKALWKMLRDMQAEQRNISRWRNRLQSPNPPKGGFDGIATKALKLGRIDLAKEALLKQMRYLTRGQHRLSSVRVTDGIRKITRKLKAIARRLEDPNLNSLQRETMQAWLAETGDELIGQMDSYIKRWTKYAGHKERKPGEVGKALSVIRNVSRIRLETKLATTKRSDRQKLLASELVKASRDVLNKEKKIIRLYEPYGKKITSIPGVSKSLRLDLSALNVARAFRDGIEDFSLDTASKLPKEEGLHSYGFLTPKTERDNKIREIQSDISGAAPGTSGKALRSYRKKVGSSRWQRSARENAFNKEGSVKLAESTFGKARGDEWLNLIRAEDRLAYLERRRLQLVKEDPHRTQGERDILYDALLKHDSEVLLAQGVSSNAFSELSQSIINLGETNPNRRESERVKSLIDVDRQQRQMVYFEKARKDGVDVQRGLRALVQLRERSLAGEINAFVEYMDRPWYRAGPGRAYNLVIGMKATQESIEWTTAQSGKLDQALIRASYRKPEKLSKEDRLLLTRHGFLVDNKYTIPQHVKITPTTVATDFVKVTSEGVLGGVDRILNAAQATELVATIVLPGAYAARFGKGFISALEATGSSWLGARLLGTAGEALVFAGLSRSVQTAIDPEKMLSGELWTFKALGKEYLHSFAVLGALKIYGGTTGKILETVSKSTRLPARVAESVLRNSAVLGEAGLLTGLNGLLSGQHISQESFAENLVMIALMRGVHKDSYKGTAHVKNKILRRLGYTPTSEVGPVRRGQTAETMERYNEWLGDTHIPGRTLMIKFGGSWSKAREAYQKKKISKEEMRAMFEFRRRVVDSLANEIAQELGVKFEAFGSENLTSDYDLSFVGPLAEVAVMRFNKRIRARWAAANDLGGIESGLTLDTNVYTGPRYVEFKGGREDVWFQDIASQTASRKYMDDAAWQKYRELVLSQAEPGNRSKLREMLDTVELRQKQYQQELQKAIDSIAKERGVGKGDPSLQLKTTSLKEADLVRTKAENVMYEKTMQEIVKLMEVYRKAGRSERKILAQQIRNLQSKALYFAQEAYFSEAAIKHIVMNTQAAGRKITVESLLSSKLPKLKLSMTSAEGRQSFVEQLANMYKELSHEGASDKLSSKAAKYFIRALDAAKIAGVDLKSFKDVVESTVEINDNRADLEVVKEILKKKYADGGGEAYLRKVLEAATTLTAEIVSGKKNTTIDGTLGSLPETGGFVQRSPAIKGTATGESGRGTGSGSKKRAEASKEKADPSISKRRTPRNPELMKGQEIYLPKLNRFALEVATKLFFGKFKGDWALVYKARKSNKISEYERKLLDGLEQDLVGILNTQSKYVADILHKKTGSLASPYQIAYFLNHPKFAEMIRRGAEDLIRRAAVEFDNQAARSYLAHKNAGELNVVLDPTIEALGLFHPKGMRLPDGSVSDGKTIFVNPFFRDPRVPGSKSQLRTLDDIASTMLHEFTHRMGYNEVRAWWEHNRFLHQLGRKGSANIESIFDEYGNIRVTGTKDLVDFIQTHGRASAAKYLEAELGRIYDPLYEDPAFWFNMTTIGPETFSPIPMPKSSSQGRVPSKVSETAKMAQGDPTSPNAGQSKNTGPRWKARAKEMKVVREMLEKLGMSADDALFTTAIQLIQNNRTVVEAVSIGAYNRALPPQELLKIVVGDTAKSQVRKSLDTYLRDSRKISDAAHRKNLIDQYLSGEKTVERQAELKKINDRKVVKKIPAKQRIVAEEFIKRGFSRGKAEQLAVEYLVNQGLPLIDVMQIAQNSFVIKTKPKTSEQSKDPADAPTAEHTMDVLEGFDIIKKKIGQSEAADQKAAQEIVNMRGDALLYLSDTSLYKNLVKIARETSSMHDLRRLQIMGMLREGMTTIEKIRSDEAYLLIEKLLGGYAKGVSFDPIDAAKYVNYHAPRVNPTAPEGSNRGRSLTQLSRKGAATLLAVEALLTQSPRIEMSPEIIARKTGLPLSEALQVLETARINLGL